MSYERLRTVRETLRRAEAATTSCMCTLVEGAKRMRSETEVLTAARIELDEILGAQR